MPLKAHDVTSPDRSSHLSSISCARRIVFRARQFRLFGIGLLRLPRTPHQHLDMCSKCRDERARRRVKVGCAIKVLVCASIVLARQAQGLGRQAQLRVVEMRIQKLCCEGCVILVAVFRPHGCRQVSTYCSTVFSTGMYCRFMSKQHTRVVLHCCGDVSPRPGDFGTRPATGPTKRLMLQLLPS